MKGHTMSSEAKPYSLDEFYATSRESIHFGRIRDTIEERDELRAQRDAAVAEAECLRMEIQAERKTHGARHANLETSKALLVVANTALKAQVERLEKELSGGAMKP